MGPLWQDVRFGARVLIRHPGFALVAVLTLGLGIGANASIFSVIDAVLLRPLPFREPDRLVSVWETRLDRGWTQSSFTHAGFWDVHDMARTFDGIAALGYGTINLTGNDHPDRLSVGRISANFFQVLGVTPVAGRLFAPGEDVAGGDSRVTLLSHSLWTSRFGRDSTIVGRKLMLDGQR
jgi:putative ABC transport system permease protein